jgi:2,4-dienoyl-CoA reductase-like NADH-dependent reductase (Old Yellow Enzyme family)
VTNLAAGGLPGERFATYFTRRASGGAGLIVLEEAQVHPSSHPYQRALRAYDPRIVSGWRLVGERVHDAGALVLAQLSHAGMQGTGHIQKQVLWAPSAVPNPATLEMPKVMEPEDVAAVVKGFADAARLAVEAGLDGVEVNAGQHSLVRQFLSGLTNRRTDAYGGDPGRRLRFASEVLAAVRGSAGPSAIVGLRLCCDELAPWAGIRPEEAPGLASALASEGVDYVSVVIGSIYSVHATRAGMHEPPGYALEAARSVRDALDGLPVLASGSLVDVAQAASAIGSGACDAVEMTRALIADPDLPSKVAEGRVAAVRPCIRCNQDCSVRNPTNAIVTCIHNPEAGYELDPPLRPRRATSPSWGEGLRGRAGVGAERSTQSERHVLVIGGGPAGMEAARSAALAGLRVTLLERSPALGGTPALVASSGQREPFGLVSSWLAARLAELEVEVRTGLEATAELVLASGAGLVVVATGARPAPTVDAEISVREVLAGHLPGSGRVVVIDRQGGYPAIDAARVAAGRGRPVTIVSEDVFTSMQLGSTGELTPWYHAAASLGIELRPLTTVAGVEPGGVRLRHRFGILEELLEADCVVVAGHELPDDSLYQELRKTRADGGPEVCRVGDCLAPRRVLQAILEGGRACMRPALR